MQLTEETVARPAERVAGGAAFTIGAFGLVVGVLVVLQRVGAADPLLRVLGTALPIVMIAVVAAGAATMRLSRFMAGSRMMPATGLGMATAGVCAGLAFGLVKAAGSDPTGALVALAGGLALAAVGVGPLLHRRAAASLPALLIGRFEAPAVRWCVVAAAAFAALLAALAGVEIAVRGLAAGTGLARSQAVTLAALLVAAVALPGGIGGLGWAAAAGGGIAIATFGLTVTASVAPHFRVPLPFAGDPAGWASAVTRLAAWHDGPPVLGRAPAGIWTLALGLAVLLPLLVPPVLAPPSSGSARRAGIVALLVAGVLAALAAATAALTILAMDPAAIGPDPERFPPGIYDASRDGLATVCGGFPATPAAARQACATAATAAAAGPDIRPTDRGLLVGLPRVRGLGGAFAGLTEGAVACLGIVLAAAGLLAAAATLTSDGLFGAADSRVSASARMAATRALCLGGVLLLAIVAHSGPLAPERLAVLAGGIGCGVLAPLVGLALWPRASTGSALASLVASLLAGGSALLTSGDAASIPALTSATAGAFLAAVVAAGIFTLLLPSAPRQPAPG